ncbi:hypothetical protein [Streptomyces sp. NPDC055055]
MTTEATDLYQCWRTEPHPPHTWTRNPETGGVDCPGRVTPKPPAQARTPYTEWQVELLYEGSWTPSGPILTDHDAATAYFATRQQINPFVTLRLVRKTTTSTVEAES